MPIEELAKKVWALLIAVVVLGTALLVLGIKFLFKDDNDHRSVYTNSYAYAQILVKDELKSPKSAKFPMYDKSFIEYDEENHVAIVRSYVDAENSYGTQIRTQYVATITLSGDTPTSGFVVLK